MGLAPVRTRFIEIRAGQEDEDKRERQFLASETTGLGMCAETEKASSRSEVGGGGGSVRVVGSIDSANRECSGDLHVPLTYRGHVYRGHVLLQGGQDNKKVEVCTIVTKIVIEEVLMLL